VIDQVIVHPRVSSRRLDLVILLCLGACGPDVEVPTQGWMLGTFSSSEPHLAVPPPVSADVVQYHVSVGEDIHVIWFSSDTVVSESRGPWEPLDENSFAVFPDPQADPGDVDEWRITRTNECGPYSVDEHTDEDRWLDVAPWYRGEVCVRPATDCGPEGCVPSTYEYYWCTAAPPPCEE